MNNIVNVGRRGFFKSGILIVGGLILGFAMPLGGRRSGAAKTSEEPSQLNAFLRINKNGLVTIFVNHSEMGQGIYTSLPMLIAEELQCDWNSIRVEAAPVAPAYNHTQWGIQGTGGSTSVRSEWIRLRQVGATAREMLITAAAKTWNVEPASCKANNGEVIHKSGKKLSYSELAEDAAKLPVPKNVRLKDPSEFNLIGKPIDRLDVPDKATGKAKFGIDVTVPDMLVALIERPPIFGAKLVKFLSEKAKSVPGVHDVVQIPAGIAVVADGYWAAKKGREELEVTWDQGPNATLSTDHLRDKYRKLAQTDGAIARKEGDVEKVLKSVKKTITAEYEVPFLAHACMEPLNCVAHVRPDGCDIWTGTQFQTMDRAAAAKAAGLKPDQVKIHTMFLGGGFGRRANPPSDFVVEAVQVSKAVKKPVKVIWTREDDTRGGYYRPMWYDRFVGGVDETGNPKAWKHVIVGQSILKGTPFEPMLVKNGIDATSVEGAEDLPYEIGNLRVDLHTPDLGVPVQWWRSVGHSHNAFVTESFFDELAHAGGADPYELRAKLLVKNPRHKGVLDLAAKKAGWGTYLPKRRSRGIAVHKSYGSYVAQVAEVSVGDDGRVTVHRVVCAIDCGRVVNPNIVAAQMESGIVFGLSAALYGEITFKNGRVQQSNFHNYPILKLDAMPQVEVHIVPSTEALGGIGEIAVPPVAPAVCNAIFTLTGKRIRRLPIDPAELRKA